MTATLSLAGFVLCASIIFLVPVFVAPSYVAKYGSVTIAYTSIATLPCLVIALLVGFIVNKAGSHGKFLLNLFVGALLIRMLVGSVIFVANGQDFFGGDAFTYDWFGHFQLRGWSGDKYSQIKASTFTSGGAGWGMVYYVAALYWLIGRNMLAVQLLNAVMGAATAPLVFLCAHSVFENAKVSRLAALAAAFTPSLVLWSSQGLKDGPIMFFLALAILSTLRLGERFRMIYLLALVSALFCVLAFRFYVFYMLAVAVGGALLIGIRPVTGVSFVRQFVVMVVMGLALTYFGVTRYASLHLESFGSLGAVQLSRADAAHSAQSGYAKDIDVSTSSGALRAIPIGLAYLLFGPFPWQLGSLRQSLTVPEMLVWWASFPMLVLGVWYSIRYRLRQISPILIFTVMLTLAYSVFQGNVGNAYRQRSQLLVFYFIFVAVGYVLMQERKQDKAIRAHNGLEPEQKEFDWRPYL